MRLTVIFVPRQVIFACASDIALRAVIFALQRAAHGRLFQRHHRDPVPAFPVLAAAEAFHVRVVFQPGADAVFEHARPAPVDSP